MSFPAYPSYRDSGIEWLAEVPSHWVVHRLSYSFRTISSGTTPPSDRSELYGGDVNWVTTGELREVAISETAKTVTSEALDALPTLKVYPPGTLLIAMYGATIGRLGWLAAPAATNQACCALADPIGIDPRFGFFVLAAAKESLILLSSGGGQPNINQEKIRAFPIPLPPLTEQTAIAAFLDRETAKVDALVEEQRRLIELLKEKRQAVISHAVTKGLDPTVAMKDSGVEWLGEVPAHWAVKPLKYLAAFRSGGTPSKDNRDFWNGEVPWASAKDLKRDFLIDTVDHLTHTAIEQGAATLVPAGSVLVLVRGMMLARTFPVCESGVPMTINQDLKALLPASGVNGSYLAWLLRGTATETLNRLDEAGHGTKALRMEAWVSMQLPMPAEDEQGVIVAYLERAVGAIDALCDQATAATLLLQERRAALISAAVTGKIDVRNSGLARAEAA